MNKTTKLKEAIKTGLAFALVFGIAMQFGWMNPYWAGWAVAVIALPTAGEAIRKGTLRVLGTIPGCLAALVIHALAPQDRWIFLLLTCAWVFGTSYLMVSRPKTSYFWVMACYVCLVILLSDIDSSENMFESAVFRTVETVMGVLVYTLIAVFVWPQTNLGAIKKSSAELAAALTDIYRAGRDTMLGQRAAETAFQGLQGKVVQKLAQFAQVLQAEGSESYEVNTVRQLWERFQRLSTTLLETAARWQSGLAELERIDVRMVLPDLPAFFSELDFRFATLPEVLAGRSPGDPPRTARLEVDPAALQRLSSFDRAAIEVARKEMEHLEALTAALLECARELGGRAPGTSETKPMPAPGVRDQATRFPVPDWDHVRSAFFVAATTGVGFLIWILFDPPGHSGWFQLSGTIALMVALCPQVRASRMIIPVAVTSLICLAIYVWVMPQLSSFLGLGLLLFTCMFLNCYFMSGMGRFFVSMAILNILQIQNHQVYAFAAMANAVLFLVMAFMFLYVMSYILGSPRPEKAVLRLLDRFFRSAEFLMSRKAPEPGQVSGLDRWRIAFHQRQLRSLPAKLAAWGKAIDRKHFPENTPEQTQVLVTSIQALVYRLEQFLEAGVVLRAEPLSRELREGIMTWHVGLEAIFGRWARNPEAEPVAALRQRLKSGLIRLEAQIEEVVNQAEEDMTREEGENFFRMLGGYRGVSEAALAYAGAAQVINWSHWREERFS
ncbi:MAG: FUSC family protein [Desulfobacterales bacterium]